MAPPSGSHRTFPDQKASSGVQLIHQADHFRFRLAGPAKTEVNEIEIEPPRQRCGIRPGWMRRSGALHHPGTVAHDGALQRESGRRRQMGVRIHSHRQNPNLRFVRKINRDVRLRPVSFLKENPVHLLRPRKGDPSGVVGADPHIKKTPLLRIVHPLCSEAQPCGVGRKSNPAAVRSQRPVPDRLGHFALSAPRQTP